MWWHDEPILGELRLSVTLVPGKISCVIPVHARMTCCISRKQHTMWRWISRPPTSSNSQTSHYTSIFSFIFLHQWWWWTHISNLTSRRINQRPALQLCFRDVSSDVHSEIKFQWYQRTRRESYAWWPVFILLPLIHTNIMTRNKSFVFRSRLIKEFFMNTAYKYAIC